MYYLEGTVATLTLNELAELASSPWSMLFNTMMREVPYPALSFEESAEKGTRCGEGEGVQSLHSCRQSVS